MYSEVFTLMHKALSPRPQQAAAVQLLKPLGNFCGSTVQQFTSPPPVLTHVLVNEYREAPITLHIDLQQTAEAQ